MSTGTDNSDLQPIQAILQLDAPDEQKIEALAAVLVGLLSDRSLERHINLCRQLMCAYTGAGDIPFPPKHPEHYQDLREEPPAYLRLVHQPDIEDLRR